MTKFITPSSIVFHVLIGLSIGLFVGANYHIGIESGSDRFILWLISNLYDLKNL
jgi:hypothetical protein